MIEEFELIEVVLNEVITEQRAYLGAGSKISLSLDLLGIELNPVKASSAHLKRVFTNLIRNSIEAVDTTGIITVTIKRNSVSTVLISVEDTGVGFSEDSLKSLFKKGFTTKENGSGRGLSFCQEKIRSWGGTILVESIAGKTRIDIELPLADLSVDFVSPSVLQNAQDLVVVDDRPLESELRALTDGPIQFVMDLEATREMLTSPLSLQGKTILFDLHLGHGKKALEVLSELPKGQDYIFMTSDYLNAELMQEAQKCQFLVIPKDLVGHALETVKKMTNSSALIKAGLIRSESSAQV